MVFIRRFSITRIIGLRLASKPADSDHPYGHGKLSNVNAFYLGRSFHSCEYYKNAIDKFSNP